MKCACGKEIKGRGSKCAKCYKVDLRAKKRDSALLDKQRLENAPESPVLDNVRQVGHNIPPMLDNVRHKLDKPDVLLDRPESAKNIPPEQQYLITQEQLDALPKGVTRPGSGVTDWSDTIGYRRTVYNLIHLSLNELRGIGQPIPVWRLHQTDCLC